jgi:hypothetical protein
VINSQGERRSGILVPPVVQKIGFGRRNRPWLESRMTHTPWSINENFAFAAA